MAAPKRSASCSTSEKFSSDPSPRPPATTLFAPRNSGLGVSTTAGFIAPTSAERRPEVGMSSRSRLNGWASPVGSTTPSRRVITSAPHVAADVTLNPPPYTEWWAITPLSSRSMWIASTASAARVRAANRPAASRPSTECDTSTASGVKRSAAPVSASTSGRLSPFPAGASSTRVAPRLAASLAVRSPPPTMTAIGDPTFAAAASSPPADGASSPDGVSSSKTRMDLSEASVIVLPFLSQTVLTEKVREPNAGITFVSDLDASFSRGLL